MSELKPCPFCKRVPAIWESPDNKYNITCNPCHYTITKKTRAEVVSLYEENWELFRPKRAIENNEFPWKGFEDAGYTAVEIAAILTHDDRR